MTAPDSPALFDAVIVGGGPAGLSAALTLGRARRRVLVVHDGPTRNAPAHAAHGVFTRDGTAPADLLRIGREQLVPYGVEVRDTRVNAITPEETPSSETSGGFAVSLAMGETVRARKVVLATGVRDVLPDVPGFRELWGAGVYHCPFCHGWEVGGQPLALYADAPHAMHLATLLKGWTDDLVLFTDGPSDLSANEIAQLERNGISVRQERVERLDGRDGHLEAVLLSGGESVSRAGLFVAAEQEPRSDLDARLGCARTDGDRVEADMLGRTSVPGVYVAGDASPALQQVISAAASGSAAGAGVVFDLAAEAFVS